MKKIKFKLLLTIILAIPPFLSGIIVASAANALENHKITFVDDAWNDASGYLSYEYEGKTFTKETGNLVIDKDGIACEWH